MKYLILISAFLSFVSMKGACQSKRMGTKISYLELKDSTLVENIKRIINKEVNSDTSKNNMFRKGLGYILLEVKQHFNSDTLRQYYIDPQLLSFKDDTDDRLYPDYFSFVDNRLVIIHLQVLDEFTKRYLTAKTKSNFRKLINSYLGKTKKMTFYDVDNKKAFTDKNFRIDYFKFDSGVMIYILKNGSALVIDEK